MDASNQFPNQGLSPWWRRGVFIILIVEFAVLIWVSTGTYFRNVGPPVPEAIADSAGTVLFSKQDIALTIKSREDPPNGIFLASDIYIFTDCSYYF